MLVETDNRIKARIIRVLHTKLLAWYQKNRRTLPWRRTRDPYAVLVSEIMLQQTRVAVVIPYFERWMNAFPTVESLAKARLERVLKLWAGLGYYSRARNLHEAAKLIVGRHACKVPRDVASLLTLPGVGRYTAGAIASIAFNQPAPILDGNVIRVLARLFRIEADTTKSETRERLWELAGEIIPPGHASKFNQALMELGALVCIPGAPLCESCPLRRVCLAKAAKKAEALPILRKRKPTKSCTEYAAVCRRNGKVRLEQRSDGELMAGLWTFPRFASRSALVNHFAWKQLAPVGKVTHSIMDRRITVRALQGEDPAVELPSNGRVSRWVPIARLDNVALPSADRQIAALLR